MHASKTSFRQKYVPPAKPGDYVRITRKRGPGELEIFDKIAKVVGNTKKFLIVKYSQGYKECISPSDIVPGFIGLEVVNTTKIRKQKAG